MLDRAGQSQSPSFVESGAQGYKYLGTSGGSSPPYPFPKLGRSKL